MLGEPRSHRELVALVHRAGWVPDARLADMLGRTVAFPNVLVHGYDTVNLDIVRSILERHLDDLMAFVEALRPRLRAS